MLLPYAFNFRVNNNSGKSYQSRCYVTPKRKKNAFPPFLIIVEIPKIREYKKLTLYM